MKIFLWVVGSIAGVVSLCVLIDKMWDMGFAVGYEEGKKHR